MQTCKKGDAGRGEMQEDGGNCACLKSPTQQGTWPHAGLSTIAPTTTLTATTATTATAAATTTTVGCHGHNAFLCYYASLFPLC